MKNKALLLLLVLFGGCAYLKPEGSGSDSTVKPVVTDVKEIKAIKRPGPDKKTRALFHVVDPLPVEIIIYNLDRNREERLKIDKTLSHIGLDVGYWKVVGFILKEKRYNLLPAKHFIFRLRPNQVTYVGSYVFNCPKVGPEFMDEMKKMSFFNRYPFSSKASLCEMVVGSDYQVVKKVWEEVGDGKKRPLRLGF